MISLQVIDDFYPDPQQVRDFALEHDFGKGVEMHGHVYPGTVQPKKASFTQWFTGLLSQTLQVGVNLKGTAFVSAKAGEFTEQWIHADTICATHAAVIYLFNGRHQHGTALWRHLETNCCVQDQEFYDRLHVDVKNPQQVEDLVSKIRAEGESEDAWQMASFTEAKFNRLIVYPAKHFHSRYPRDAFGDTVENSRLIQVVFFDIA